MISALFGSSRRSGNSLERAKRIPVYRFTGLRSEPLKFNLKLLRLSKLSGMTRSEGRGSRQIYFAERHKSLICASRLLVFSGRQNGSVRWTKAHSEGFFVSVTVFLLNYSFKLNTFDEFSIRRLYKRNVLIMKNFVLNSNMARKNDFEKITF